MVILSKFKNKMTIILKLATVDQLIPKIIVICVPLSHQVLCCGVNIQADRLFFETIRFAVVHFSIILVVTDSVHSHCCCYLVCLIKIKKKKLVKYFGSNRLKVLLRSYMRMWKSKSMVLSVSVLEVFILCLCVCYLN